MAMLCLAKDLIANNEKVTAGLFRFSTRGQENVTSGLAKVWLSVPLCPRHAYHQCVRLDLLQNNTSSVTSIRLQND
jgi:hypothetical protein